VVVVVLYLFRADKQRKRWKQTQVFYAFDT